MHDIKKITNNLDYYKTRLANKKFNLDTTYFMGLVSSISNIRTECENLQAKRNLGSKQIGTLMQNKGSNAEIEAVKQIMVECTNKTKDYEAELRDKEAELRDYVLTMPNIYDDTTPLGNSDTDNLIKNYYGTKPKFDFEPLEHHILGEKMAILDTERGAKLSGSRFTVLFGTGAILDMAVKNFLFEIGRASCRERV